MTLALHTDDRWIKNSLGEIVTLYGAWAGAGADSTAGWWYPPGGPTYDDQQTFRPENVRAHLQEMKHHGLNKVNVFMVYDWWKNNRIGHFWHDAYTNPYDIVTAQRDTIRQLLDVADEEGIYVELRPFNSLPSGNRWPELCPHCGGAAPGDGRTTYHGRNHFPLFPTDDYFGITEEDSINGFIAFWREFAEQIVIWEEDRGGAPYNNLMITFFDEPFQAYEQPPVNMNNYFDAVIGSAEAMRTAGYNNKLVGLQVGACGDLGWIQTWKDRLQYRGKSLPQDMIYHHHIFRAHGTFGATTSPVNKDYLRDVLWNGWGGLGYRYALVQHALPLVNSSVGAWDYGNGEYPNELEYFRNVLEILNEPEFRTGYICYVWRVDTPYHILKPIAPFNFDYNPTGIILINSVTQLPKWNLIVNAFPISVPVLVDGVDRGSTPTEPIEVEGEHIIKVPVYVEGV